MKAFKNTYCNTCYIFSCLLQRIDYVLSDTTLKGVRGANFVRRPPQPRGPRDLGCECKRSPHIETEYISRAKGPF